VKFASAGCDFVGNYRKICRFHKRRGFLAGYRRARARARKEMHALAADYDAELTALQHEFRELAVSVHRERYDKSRRRGRHRTQRMSRYAVGGSMR